MFDRVRQSGLRRFIVLAWMAAPGAAHAQVPILDGHRFVPSSIVAWSFVDTEVSSTSEAGVTDFAIEPAFPQLAAPVQLPRRIDGSFIAAEQTVAASIAFAEIFSLNAQLSAGGILRSTCARPWSSAGTVRVGRASVVRCGSYAPRRSS
jgi:hypothetical protein